MKYDCLEEQDRERERVRNEINERLNEGRNKFQEAIALWKEIAADYDYLDEWQAMKQQVQADLFNSMDFKLDHYEYSDRWSNRCGDYGGSTTNFITWLPHGDIKQKFLAALNKDSDLCFHKFFGSLSDSGIAIQSDDATGDILSYCQSNVSEKTFLDPVEEHELFKKRKELQDQKNLAEKLEREAQERQRKLKEYERLKGDLGL